MSDVRLTATNPEDSSVVPVACNAKGELLLEEPTLSSDDYVAKSGDTMTGNLHLGDKITLNPDGSAQFANGNIDFFSNGDGIFGGIDISFSGDGFNQDYILGFKGGKSDLGFAIPQQNVLGFYHNKKQVASIDLTGSVKLLGDGVAIGSHSSGEVKYVYVYTPGENNRSSAFGVWDKINLKDLARINNDGSAEFTKDVIVGSRGEKWKIVESGGLAHLVKETRAAGIETADLNPSGETSYPPLRDIPAELTMVEEQLQKVMEKLRMAPEAGWEVWDGSD